MFYTIYKITNLVNNKYYIGKHITKKLDDGYMGSGKLIVKAIEKYGIENFKKEILFVFDNEIEMNKKEAEVVVISEQTYNLCPGGKGGFGYINRYKLGHKFTKEDLNKAIQRKKDPVIRAKHKIAVTISNKDPQRRQAMSERIQTGIQGHYINFDETKKKEIREKISNSTKGRSKNVGNKNSQYGTMWITNSIENKKIKISDTIPTGWYKGRTI